MTIPDWTLFNPDNPPPMHQQCIGVLQLHPQSIAFKDTFARITDNQILINGGYVWPMTCLKKWIRMDDIPM